MHLSSIDMEELRTFDLTSKFGPCSSMCVQDHRFPTRCHSCLDNSDNHTSLPCTTSTPHIIVFTSSLFTSFSPLPCPFLDSGKGGCGVALLCRKKTHRKRKSIFMDRSRSERFARAEKLGLSPPENVGSKQMLHHLCILACMRCQVRALLERGSPEKSLWHSRLC